MGVALLVVFQRGTCIDHVHCSVEKDVSGIDVIVVKLEIVSSNREVILVDAIDEDQAVADAQEAIFRILEVVKAEEAIDGMVFTLVLVCELRIVDVVLVADVGKRVPVRLLAMRFDAEVAVLV